MKTIVISAVNLNKGGTLTILRECLQYLSNLSETGDYRIVALVYQKDLAFFPNIEYIEMRWPKKNWINRLWCEYVTMRKISLELSPVYLWFSLHDTTPNVIAAKRAVYCHNSFPFYKWKMKEILFAPKIVLFALFSLYAYRKNIRKNQYVVVQQQWFKEELIRLFKIERKSIIVALPALNREKNSTQIKDSLSMGYSFFYAAGPDSHKNFECICQASKQLENEQEVGQFKVYITMKGDENPYAKWVCHKWGENVSALHFIGYLDKKSLYSYYNRCHCLIFPSKVETWGLPITEFAAFNKPMLLSDLPYAHETASGCKNVAFFDPDNPQELALQMKKLIRGDDSFLTTAEEVVIPSPVARSWQDLFDILLT
jgi:glycosyltransferase involved in cell wall biosynthesis